MTRTTLFMAWRNLWRQPRRTLVTASAIALGVAMLIFSHAYGQAAGEHLIRAATGALVGHAQLHATGYRTGRETEKTLPGADALLARARSLPGVWAAAPRAYATGLVAIGDRSANVTLMGVDPALETKVTNWTDRLLPGGALPAGPGDVLVGKHLAEKLDVAVGSKVVLTLPQAHSGDMSYRLAHVSGILYTSHEQLDKESVVLTLPALQDSLGLPGGVHEIALRVTVDPSDEAVLREALAPLHSERVEVATWQDLAPVLATFQDIQGMSLAVTLGLVFLVISFGVVNTMSMALMERFREFGVMRAVGTQPVHLGQLIVFEATSLGVVGAVMGLAFGLGIVAVLSQTGIPISNMAIEGLVINESLYPSADPVTVAWMTLAFVALTPLAGLGVAWRAARVDPVVALREL